MPEWRISNIVWDTEQEDGETPDQAALALPSEELYEGKEDDIAEYLSNKYGFCVYSFRFRERPGSFFR